MSLMIFVRLELAFIIGVNWIIVRLSCGPASRRQERGAFNSSSLSLPKNPAAAASMLLVVEWRRRLPKYSPETLPPCSASSLVSSMAPDVWHRLVAGEALFVVRLVEGSCRYRNASHCRHFMAADEGK